MEMTRVLGVHRTCTGLACLRPALPLLLGGGLACGASARAGRSGPRGRRPKRRLSYCHRCFHR